MIVVFVPARNSPIIFETTVAALVLMANDSNSENSHTQSIPPGTPQGAFETAWAILTKDLQSAKLFNSVEEARSHYTNIPDGLTVQQCAAILTGLARVGQPKARGE